MVICAQYYYHPMVFGWFFPFRFFFYVCVWTIFKVFIEFVTILLLFYVLVYWPRGVWHLSSLTRDWTCTPCIGRQSFNHWTTREAPTQCLRSQVCRDWSRLPKVTQLHVLGLGLHPRWKGREGSGSWVESLVSGPIAEGQLLRRGKCSMWGVEKESSYRRDKW